MNKYKPRSRRPIADIFRITANFSVKVCIKLKIHPDVISYFSVIVSIIAGILFYFSAKYPIMLIIAPLFCYFRLWCNMLDGMVALASNKASLRGEILNDLPDRISDTVVFVGIAHSYYANPFLAYWTAIIALFVSYVGIFGQAVGVQREYSGIMSKPFRMVVLHIGSWILFFSILNAETKMFYFWSLSILDFTLIFIILGSFQTIWIRLSRILKALKDKEIN